MTSTIEETLALGVAITVIVVVMLRLALATYWLWRDDQAEMGRLIEKLESPRFEAEASMRAYAIELRKELSTCLGRLVAMAHVSGAKNPFSGEVERASEEIIELDRKVLQLASQLSYDVATRVSSLQLKDYCLDLIEKRLSRKATEDDERLWAQRKLTFRIIHDDHQINELMTLMQLDILLEDHGVFIHRRLKTEKEDEDNSLEELKNIMRELGDELYKVEFIDYLRSNLDSGSTDSLQALHQKYRRKLPTS